MTRYFENSLGELAARNRDIQGRFKLLDARRLSAVIYAAGKIRAECTVHLGGMFGNGISYSASANAPGNSCNAMLSLESDDQKLFPRASMSMMGDDRDQQQSFEGAAEHYWAMLVAPLQQ